MNPGMVVKLRPAGPWRIGPDSGARNRVDAIYHSDTLYGAVTSAMAVLGLLGEWLDATARSATPAVCFSSCFPFIDDIGFVAPPRTIWPPSTPGTTAPRVRWKSARFVPLGIVQAILAGDRLDDNEWSVDGPSECLVPAGRTGPFRAGVRWNAAVDRLSGASERHSTACLEFRPGAGLWTVVSFADEAARDRWADPVKAAFRWLADSGFGGERSRGWGRSEAPEFVEGVLPEMILGDHRPRAAEEAPPVEEPPAEEPPVQEPPPAEEISEAQEAIVSAPAEEAALTGEPETSETPDSPAPDPRPPAPFPGAVPFWLLSLYTPAGDDSVDWGRGNYHLVTRGGRVNSSGELKKLLPMVAEGSVLYASSEPRGSAPDVAPDGFEHPVFRAGFAVSIPLPEAGQ